MNHSQSTIGPTQVPDTVVKTMSICWDTASNKISFDFTWLRVQMWCKLPKDLCRSCIFAFRVSRSYCGCKTSFVKNKGVTNETANYPYTWIAWCLSVWEIFQLHNEVTIIGNQTNVLGGIPPQYCAGSSTRNYGSNMFKIAFKKFKKSSHKLPGKKSQLSPLPIIQQCGLHLNDDGVLRCKGTLGQTDPPLTCKNPILLPSRNNFANLLINPFQSQTQWGQGHTDSFTRLTGCYLVEKQPRESWKVVSSAENFALNLNLHRINQKSGLQILPRSRILELTLPVLFTSQCLRNTYQQRWILRKCTFVCSPALELAPSTHNSFEI